jgi:DNA polymerase-3 subunit beta
MKISCELEKIKKAVINLAKLTLKKELNDTLSNIFFIIKNDILIIRSTNLSIGAEYYIKIENKDNIETSFSLYSYSLQDIFSSIIFDKINKNIDIDINDDNIIIFYKKNKIHINKQSNQDIPTLPVVKESSFVIDKNTLKDGIQSVLSTSSKTDIKPELSSVFISQQDSRLVFVTTDTFRLTEYSFLTNDAYSFPSVLIPTKNAQEIYKILDDSDSFNIEVYPTKNQITFITDDVFVTSQLINGVFPEYTKIIPKELNNISFLKSDMLDILKTLSPFLDIRNQIKLNFDFKKQEMFFFCKNDTLGEFSGSIPASIKEGSFEILFNKFFLEDIILKMTEVIFFTITDSKKPILIKSENKKEIVCLLMPMSQ